MLDRLVLPDIMDRLEQLDHKEIKVTKVIRDRLVFTDQLALLDQLV
jgi:hypothetical protein